MAVTMGRFAKGAILENAKRIGFHPGAVIDCGYAYGTEGLEIFEEAVYLR